MAETHVVTALVKKRSGLARDIENTQAKLCQLILDSESLDKTPLMFDPNYKIECVKPKSFRPPKTAQARGNDEDHFWAS